MTHKGKAKLHRWLPLSQKDTPLCLSRFFILSLFLSLILWVFFLFPKIFCSSREETDQGFSLWMHLES